MLNSRARQGRHIFLSCGEASGERYGCELVAALRELDDSWRFSALGGPALREAGVEIVQSAADLAVMGFGEVLAALPAIIAARRRIWRHLARAKVDLCVPVDYPGFNLRLAARARRLGIPVFYLVPPQLWAWGGWRLSSLRRHVDRLGTILPFEADYYRQRGLAVEALGHPLMEDYGSLPWDRWVRDRERRLGDPTAAITLGLLPGSRAQEVRHLLPRLAAAALILRSLLSPRPVHCILSHGPLLDQRVMTDLVVQGFDIQDQPLPRLLPRLDLALVCSGTASLETALAGVPHEIVYRASAFSYWVAKRLVKVRRIGLANLIMEQDVVREHIQHEVVPLKLAENLRDWCNVAAERHLFYAQCQSLRERCGEPGVWRRAAEAIRVFLDSRQGQG